MINFLNTAAQMVAAKSTISPDQKDLGAGTVASVVITGIVGIYRTCSAYSACVDIRQDI
jgi:hypothetical protein